jgi:formamidopyrimidine-DNA glycosylase
MPELPETETIAGDLDRLVTGCTIVGVEVLKRDVLRGCTPRSLTAALTGATILRCWRRAKLVVFDLSNGRRLAVQPRFTGSLLVSEGTPAASADDYITVAISLSDGRRLSYRDVRRLGTVELFTTTTFSRYSARLGVEPLDPDFTSARLSGLLRGSRQAVKKLLMDQRRIAGIGNIYANEALWRAGIDPSRPGRALTTDEGESLQSAIVSVLREAVAARGTTFRDYRDPSGARGGYGERLQAYGRGGQPCLRCGRRLVVTQAVDGRSTVFCPRCQS